jgi:16S rRNA A1518/A1519 N6-dimethyltransferase RsmA/KsgA/DIM1 with predicted DNA glycosylase/AP lyase activity
VDSAAIRLTRRSDVPGDLADILTFAGMCFRQKRKTLRNNLRAFYGDAMDRMPEGLMRAEQLGVTGLVELYRRLKAGGGAGLAGDQP